MARAQKLKVYRTPIGFHDAYVAAPSQKAALAAWGSDVDLFARGVAETVEDEALKREPLAHPGKVIRRSRGSAEEQLAALPPSPPKRAMKATPDTSDKEIKVVPAARRPPHDRPDHPPLPKRRQPPPKPRPSRKPLEDAERSLEKLLERQKREADDLREQEKEILRKRREAGHRHEKERADAEAKVERERRAYAEALSKT